MAAYLYSIYDADGNELAKGDVAEMSERFGVTRSMLFYYAKTGKAKNGKTVKYVPVSADRMLLCDGKVVATGPYREIARALARLGYSISESTLGKYERNKTIIGGKYRITSVLGERAQDDRIRRKYGYVEECLNKYGNTIICGAEKDIVLEDIRTKRNVKARKVKDDSRHRWHYIIEEA